MCIRMMKYVGSSIVVCREGGAVAHGTRQPANQPAGGGQGTLLAAEKQICTRAVRGLIGRGLKKFLTKKGSPRRFEHSHSVSLTECGTRTAKDSLLRQME